MNICNAFTVDVEDYYHVSAFEGHVERARWSEYESRVVTNTQRLLDLLDRHQVKATFFILGWVAEHYPELVRQIDAGGHEVGSHSYWHRLIYQQTPDEFRADLRRSRQAIADATGKLATAYRAPSFSITQKSLWALDVLVEEGFQFDSSIFPIHHDRYGIPNAQPHLHQLQTASGPLWEFPISVRRVAGINLPISGGGYFRLYPYRFTASSLGRLNKDGHPFVFYIHPWELDPDQPRLPVSSRLSRLRHYVNLASTERKLDKLLGCFQFSTLTDAICRATHGSRVPPLAPVSRHG